MTKDNFNAVSSRGNNYEGIDTHFLGPYLEFDETVPLQEGYETLKGFIKARSEDPEYQEMLRQRDELRERIWGHNKRIEKLRDPKKRDPLVDNMKDATQVQIRDAILEVRPDFEEYAQPNRPMAGTCCCRSPRRVPDPRQVGQGCGRVP